MKCENVLLSEISYTQKDKYCTISLYHVPRIDKFIGEKSRMEVTKGYGERSNGELLFNEYSVST